MDGELHNLERSVEREMRLLGDLPRVGPDAACVSRVTTAVLAESMRLARRRRFVRIGEYATGLAAAVLLVISIGLPVPKPAHLAANGDPDRALVAWERALDRTRVQLRGAADGWVPADAGNDEAELDVMLRGLDASFNALDSL